ncbi:uncharacterized protein BDR25DRAFT_357272 [Lindgomyces ingoldianus]|uniref:Uncharacterized protein n=1 Tax=Lindgomyces ingoldianus TaxID=673940 RepID=A0ACB6QQX1_9PLEO|nr:uncharacterized protein BDR25DRAFT_357272 [Lindgomyces ingoldianus]KAF2468925.1 hypothetical protein BDR25DRAFT_357272 [Lindgomyces ingoldianus]
MNWDKLHLPIQHVHDDIKAVGVWNRCDFHLRSPSCYECHLDSRALSPLPLNNIHCSGGNVMLLYSAMFLVNGAFNYKQRMIAVHICDDGFRKRQRDFLKSRWRTCPLALHWRQFFILQMLLELVLYYVHPTASICSGCGLRMFDIYPRLEIYSHKTADELCTNFSRGRHQLSFGVSLCPSIVFDQCVQTFKCLLSRYHLKGNLS